ncbi:MAG: phosphonoacetaldehyde hydrolase 2 [Harvfovirus sp.]|uniref:Phosphonoacetaldehyde hydrolase 2 n=1 Tax=Harvfovirus sp. TaxID=2487768 RepID=A0A3G5A0D4_9VIRU|nr:MAG: phosphonoacetaldehyde hydrolase 2 [Harvfovirus sp.]
MLRRAASIRLVVFDIYNTIVIPQTGLPDAPIEAFRRTFNHLKLNVPTNLIYRDYGHDKVYHLDQILTDQSVKNQLGKLIKKYGEQEMKKHMFKVFEKKQCEIVRDPRYSRLVPGFLDALTDLEYMGVKHFCTTTGFNTKMQRHVLKHMKQQGFIPKIAVASDTLMRPRPDPMGIAHIMEQCGIFDPRQVVKVGDTAADIVEGLNANITTIGVEGTLSKQQLENHGASLVIKSVKELPWALNHLEHPGEN